MQSSDTLAFLDEPGRMAQVAAVARSGIPLLGSLWFVFESERFWFSSHPSSALVKAAARNAALAVIVDDFTPPDAIRQVRVRGAGRVDPHDSALVGRIYERYLGPDRTEWPPFFQERAVDPDWTLWSVTPETGVATINPDFRASEVRWDRYEESPLTAI